MDIEAHHLTGRVRISDIEIGSRLAPAKRLIRPDVEKKEAEAGESGEIDDAVDAFRRRHQKLGTGDRLLQEATVGDAVPRVKFYSGDLPEELRVMLAAASVAPQAGRDWLVSP